MELNELLGQLNTEFKSFKEKKDEEIKNLGSVSTETKSAIDKISAEMLALHTQLDAVDAKLNDRIFKDKPDEQKSIGAVFTESKEFLDAKAGGFSSRHGVHVPLKSGVFPLAQKTNVSDTNLGSGTSGILMPQRMPGIVILAQQSLRIRDVMNVVPQSVGNSFDFVKQSTRTNNASPQVEESAKSQSYVNWTTTSGTIRTLAHYIKVSRQALDDVPWVRSQIDSELIYGLKVKEESEILSGDGTGVHLNGLITQATAFNTALLSASQGWQRLDILRYAKLQVRLAGLATYAPTAFVLNPTDLAQIELTKDGFGHYMVGNPETGAAVNMIWGLPTVESDSIAAGTFLIGAFANGATLIDRQQANVEIAYQNDTDFVSNLATILCEERIGLAVKKADTFVTGSFTTSPA